MGLPEPSRSHSQDWLTQVRQAQAFAVIRATDRECGVQMGLATAQAGLKLIEIAWNSDRAPDIVAQLRQELPHCQIGVGTILDCADLDRAQAAGAQFCFTPHCDLKLIERAQQWHLPIIPGALSPTEIVTAWQAGATCVKVFPIEAVGGPQFIRSLQGPLGQIPLIPTGGVRLDNAAAFIQAGAIAVGLSSHLFPQQVLEKQDWSMITTLGQQLRQCLEQGYGCYSKD